MRLPKIHPEFPLVFKQHLAFSDQTWGSLPPIPDLSMVPTILSRRFRHMAGGGPALLRQRAPGGRQRWAPLDHLGRQLPDGVPTDRGGEHGLRRGEERAIGGG